VTSAARQAEHGADPASQWAAIGSIAVKIGGTAETLRGWVRQAERDQGMRSGRIGDERERIKVLERENCGLRQANEILRKASAYFAGAALVSKDELMATADAVSIHMVLSNRSRGLVGAAELARMKPGAILVNTSRGPIVDAAPLLAALHAGKIVAALDAYDREPLPVDHPLRSAPNTVLSPHLGYCMKETWDGFYSQMIENAVGFLDGKPVRVTNPEILKR